MAIILDGTTGITTPDLIDSSLTSGRVVYAGASGNLTGSSGLVFDSAGNFGLGTASPTASASNRTLTINAPATFGSLLDFKTNETLNLRIFSGVTNSVLSVKTATYLSFETNDTERIRIPADAGGIQFPAVQAASSNANTLDDYEEGTWTPTITPQSGSLTAYTSSGTYTKIGRAVTVTFNTTITTSGTASGFMSIFGFPFTNGNGYQAPTLCREQNNTGIAYQAAISNSATTGFVRTLTETGISWTAGSQYVFFMTYIV